METTAAAAAAAAAVTQNTEGDQVADEVDEDNGQINGSSCLQKINIGDNESNEEWSLMCPLQRQGHRSLYGGGTMVPATRSRER